MYDPERDKVHRVCGLLGHMEGKCAVRLGPPVRVNGAHRFCRLDGTRLRTRRRRWLLHYNCYDFTDFLKKQRNFARHPDRYLCGNAVERVPKRLWRDLVNSSGLDEGALREYYRRWVLCSDAQLAALRRRSPLGRSDLVEVASVAELFRGPLRSWARPGVQA